METITDWEVTATATLVQQIVKLVLSMAPPLLVQLAWIPSTYNHQMSVNLAEPKQTLG